MSLSLEGHVLSVQPEWARRLPIQQQSVLFLAARGADGIPKFHPTKRVQRAYRASVFMAARYGRMLTIEDEGDSFMSLEDFEDNKAWVSACTSFFDNVDSLPHHFLLHLIHGAEILGYKHPDPMFRSYWMHFYDTACHHFHMNMETEAEMDARLNDWGQVDW